MQVTVTVQATLTLDFLYLCIYSFLITAAPSVVVNFNDTRCAADGGRVCATDSLLFTCTGNEIGFLRVTLFSGERLALFSDGDITGIGDLHDGFSVEPPIVTMNDGGASFNYTLSVSIENASLLNGNMIDCDDNSPDNQDMAGCPVVDSPPAAPSGLEQVSSANILTSANVANATFKWQEPTDTGGGGIDIAHYTVDTNLANVTILNYTLTDLEVETDYSVSVTATNECGLESNPSELVIRIPAGKPPAPTIHDPVIQCQGENEVISLVNVAWTYADTPSMPSPEGLVYPPITNVTLSYTDPVNMTTVTACGDLSGNNSSCSFNLSLTQNGSQTMFNITVEVLSVVGSSVSQRTLSFESDVLRVEYFLDPGRSPAPLDLGLKVTLNPLCATPPISNVFVQGLFGTKLIGSEDCEYLQSTTQVFNYSHTVFIVLDLTLESDDYVYCADYLLNGREMLEEMECDSQILSSGAVAGIAVTISVLMALPLGVLIGCWGVWCGKRWGREDTQKEQQQQLQGAAIYEEPGPVATAIPLSDNLAYGHVSRQRGN